MNIADVAALLPSFGYSKNPKNLVRVYTNGDTTGQTATKAIQAAITRAGVGGTIELFGGSSDTYYIGAGFEFLDQQKFRCHGNPLKFINQVVTQITAPVTITSGDTSTVFHVPSVAGFWIGMEFGFEDKQTAGKITINGSFGIITAIDANALTITVSWVTTNYLSAALVTWDTATNLGSIPSSPYTCAIGTYVFNTCLALRTSRTSTRCFFDQVVIDGNRTNYAYGRYWEIMGGGDLRGDFTFFSSMHIYDSPSDAIQLTGVGTHGSMLELVRPAGLGVHFGASDATHGFQNGVITTIKVDSPGMLGTAFSGHYQGPAQDPCYPGIAHSRNTADFEVGNYIIENNYGSTMACGVGLFTGSDNARCTYNNGHVRDMTHGAIKVGNGSVGTSDPYLASGEIHFKGLDVYNCGDTDQTLFRQTRMSWIGANSGNVPCADLVKLSDFNFVDSPLIIESADHVLLADGTLRATSFEKTSSLVMQNGANAKKMHVTCNNVTSIRPRGPNAQYNGSWQQQAMSCIYINGGSTAGSVLVDGSYLCAVGGDTGVRLQTGAKLDVAVLETVDQYLTGIVEFSSNSDVKIGKLKGRVRPSSQTFTTASTNVDTTADTVNMGATTTWPVGTLVQYLGSTGSTIGGLNQYYTYFWIPTSTTAGKLATSLSNAVAGIGIDLTSQGSGNHVFGIASGIATSGAYICADDGQSGAQTMTIGEVDIDIYATTSTNTGIRLSAATSGQGTHVRGGSVKVKGTHPVTGAAVDGTSLSGGTVSTKNSLVNVSRYPAFTAGAGDQDVNGVTLSNLA